MVAGVLCDRWWRLNLSAAPAVLSADGALCAPPRVTAQNAARDNFYHGKSDEAAAEGAQVVNGLQSGVFATIDACVRTVASKRKFQDDVEAITAFLGPLVEAKVISESEARLGLASPKLSMLCKSPM